MQSTQYFILAVVKDKKKKKYESRSNLQKIYSSRSQRQKEKQMWSKVKLAKIFYSSRSQNKKNKYDTRSPCESQKTRDLKTFIHWKSMLLQLIIFHQIHRVTEPPSYFWEDGGWFAPELHFIFTSALWSMISILYIIIICFTCPFFLFCSSMFAIAPRSRSAIDCDLCLWCSSQQSHICMHTSLPMHLAVSVKM